MPAREPMNAELQEVAKMPEIPNVRNWGNSRPEDCDEWMTLSKQEIRECYPASNCLHWPSAAEPLSQ